MFQIMSTQDAVALIKDGDCIGINSFLALSNPESLHDAITESFRETGHPAHLSLFCSAGFGCWDKTRCAEPYVAAGAVDEVVAGHFSSMPEVTRLALENKIEAYNLPLGVLSHTVRAAASGKDGVLSEVGKNIFVDPRVGTYALNERSKKQLVQLVTVDGKEYLYYKTPKFDVAFIKGTTVDPNGNITFENEYLTVDALALAQATKANGGKVFVEVERISHNFGRPRNVIVPGALVDVVVVNEDRAALDFGGALSGDIHVPATHMDYYMGKLTSSKKGKSDSMDESVDIIGNRAAHELLPGQIVNIGIGIPETVGKFASKLGVLKQLTATVEAGGIGGLPAPGVSFGATIGADMISDMAVQFDFYDGGGLDICFMGGFEVDKHGNVNAHQIDGRFAGIGGFANITFFTKIIVFCMNFTTKGIDVRKVGDKVQIVNEGSVKKFKDEIKAVSFSAKNALAHGQRVLYVTERCVFELTENGLKLAEVYDGVDEQKDIRDLLDFPLA